MGEKPASSTSDEMAVPSTNIERLPPSTGGDEATSAMVVEQSDPPSPSPSTSTAVEDSLSAVWVSAATNMQK
jgi:hypothetical protein